MYGFVAIVQLEILYPAHRERFVSFFLEVFRFLFLIIISIFITLIFSTRTHVSLLKILGYQKLQSNLNTTLSPVTPRRMNSNGTSNNSTPILKDTTKKTKLVTPSRSRGASTKCATRKRKIVTPSESKTPSSKSATKKKNWRAVGSPG